MTLYHSGTANTDKPELSVAQLANKLAEKGISVFGVTENGEPCTFGGYETSVKLQQAGVIPLGKMTHDVALAKLRLLSKISPDELVENMTTNMVGEF